MRLQNSFVCFAFFSRSRLQFSQLIFSLKNFFLSLSPFFYANKNFLLLNFFLSIKSIIDNKIFINFPHTFSTDENQFLAHTPEAFSAALEVQLFTKLLLFNALFKFPFASLALQKFVLGKVSNG